MLDLDRVCIGRIFCGGAGGACGLESARGNCCVGGEELEHGSVGGDLDTDEVAVDCGAGGDPRMEGREEGRYATYGDDWEEAAETELVANGNKFSSNTTLRET
ncbi:hypothetical protein ACJW30_03G153600 [Castanea mollissima]